MFSAKTNTFLLLCVVASFRLQAQAPDPRAMGTHLNVPSPPTHITTLPVKKDALIARPTIGISNTDSIFIRQFFNTGLPTVNAYKILSGLCAKYPKRLAGSPGANGAIQYMAQQLREAGADTVWLQPAMVPHWVRGNVEKCTYKNKKLAVTTLGGSVATPVNGIDAAVVEIHNFEELKTRNVKGKIVFYNTPFDNTELSTFRSYGKAVKYRGDGANMAAKYGAVATIVRSMASNINDYPHTGAMHHYVDSLPKIPSGAISTLAAEELHTMLLTDSVSKMHLILECKMLPDTLQYNVIGEYRGTDSHAGIIIVGGHLDAWETGDGAHDDGAGCAHSVEVMRLTSQSGKRPSHTLRVVLFINEENGLRGGLALAEYIKSKKENVVAAIETDAGGFTPRGFDFGCTKELLYTTFEYYKNMFKPYGCDDWQWSKEGSGGADIGPLKGTVPLLIEFVPDSQRYFDVHHAASDNINSVSPRELEMGACCIAALIFVLDKTL